MGNSSMGNGVRLKLIMTVVEDKQWRETMQDLFIKQIFAGHLYRVQCYLEEQLIKRKRIKKLKRKGSVSQKK